MSHPYCTVHPLWNVGHDWWGDNLTDETMATLVWDVLD